MSILLVNCKDDDKKKTVDPIEDGFYVVGDATTIANLDAKGASAGLMAAGINEVTKVVRQGMYEKYVALEGGKEFNFVLKAGSKETTYGATLSLSETLSGDSEPAIQVYKGALAENGAAMKVTANGLYHIIVDVPLSKVIIAPVEWGVRGAMNSWGYTAFPAPTFNQETMTYTLAEVTVEIGGGFKFAYGSGWKIELSGEEVKVECNLGNDGGEDNDPLTSKITPGGKNIGIERAVWKIELTWNLAKGAIKDGYTAKLTKVRDLEPLPEYPEKMYIIGSFCGWNWGSNDVISMIPVHSHPYAFWAITFFDVEYEKDDDGNDTDVIANTGFKFCSVKEWTGDFGASGSATDGVYAKGGNDIKVASGYYIIYVDLKAEKIFVGEPSVYLIGNCSKNAVPGEDGTGWDTGDAGNKFAVSATGLTITTYNEGNLRMYAACPFGIADWWQMEFNIFDGKIEYRGIGGDQTSVSIAAAKNITLDFKAGTGKIE